MTQISLREESPATRLDEKKTSESITPAEPVMPRSPETTIRLMQAAFTAAPILAGLDKFTNLLTDWEKYLDPRVPRMLGVKASTFMRVVGAVEVAAGVGVAVRPRLFGRVVSAWLLGIIGNLLMKRDYYDVALRDLGLAVGAYAVSELASDAKARRAIAPAAQLAA